MWKHPAECRSLLPNLLQQGDLVMLLGAGDIGAVATQLYAEGFVE